MSLPDANFPESIRRRAAVLALALLATGAVTLPAAATATQMPTRPLRLPDYYALIGVEDPALSPDGSRVAFVRTEILEEQDRVRREIWIAPADGSPEPRRLTSPEHDASRPLWSPDGRLLAFRSRRRVPGERPGSAWWFLDLEAGGEAFRIEGVEGRPYFSPDGRWIAFTRPTPPTGEAAARSRNRRSRYEVVPEYQARIEERFQGQIIDWMQYRYDGTGYLTDPTDPVASPPLELYVVPRSGGTPRQLTRLGVDVIDVAWHPAGDRMAFSADAHQRDEHTYERHDLWTASLDGTVTRLTDDGWVNEQPVWTADGAALVFRRQEGLDRLLERRADRGAPVDLVRLPVDGDAAPDTAGERLVSLTADWDFGVGAPTIVAGGNDVLFATDVDGEHHLFAVPATGGPVRQVTEGRRWLAGFDVSADGSRIAYTASTASRPEDLYVARADGSGEARISRFNDVLLGNVVLAGARNFRFASTDGTEIEGWAILPPGYRDGEERGGWPLILAIHGGPHGAYGERFDFEFQLWATAGYIVVYANPRGSSGYGEDFLWATWGGGWGGLDTDDVMSAVGYALDTWDVDPERLGVTGYSYGGFLTNWLITQTDRFAAAVSGAGISNWLSDYATSDIPRTKESEFYGPPWDPEAAELLWQRSPVKHAAGVTTPTLFLHGEEDWRVPIEQAEQMYLALRKQRVPARFIRYPATSHGGWGPWDTVHAAWQTLEWWQRWLSGAADGRRRRARSPE